MAKKKTYLKETENIPRKFWVEYIDEDLLKREKKIDFIVNEFIKIGESDMKKKSKFHILIILFRGYLDDLMEVMERVHLESSEKDAIRFMQILETADGGCSYCVADLFKLFIKKFPQHKELAEKELKLLKLKK